MKRKERFLAALHHQPADRVPMFDFMFQRPIYKAVIGREPAEYNAKDAIECALALDLDAVWLPFGGFNGYQPKFLASNTYVDEWGTTYQQSASSWPIDAPVAYPIQSKADLAAYKCPDPGLPGRDLELRVGLAMPNDDIAITGVQVIQQGAIATAEIVHRVGTIGFDDLAQLLETQNLAGLTVPIHPTRCGAMLGEF